MLQPVIAIALSPAVWVAVAVQGCLHGRVAAGPAAATSLGAPAEVWVAAQAVSAVTVTGLWSSKTPRLHEGEQVLVNARVIARLQVLNKSASYYTLADERLQIFAQ